ncbi:stage II sporulation protein M [Paenibacillus puldeungensis]|uniref:Stage II sporulation protein M n=1 Tax=Paenibacillus puldeungensis TaxID=696536 RepID=A0ABW3S3N3_9BACL
MFSFRKFLQDIIRFKGAMLVSLLLFVTGVVLGAINADSITRWILPDIERLGEYSRRLSQSEHPELSFFVFIFFNNALKSIGVMALGALFCLIPAFFLFMNGLALGYVVVAAGAHGESTMSLILRGLLPHGIIEIPAILVAAAFGLQFGYLVIKSLGERGSRDASERTVEWRKFFVSAGRAAFWIVILLLIAAAVESTLTFYLMGG